MSADGDDRRRRVRPGSAGAGAGRGLAERVKSAKGRKLSSTLWLERQLNDPYVRRAKAEGWRSRAAFKLIELDDRFGIIPKGGAVIDLGAAPGGWTQVALARGAGRVIGVDLLPIDPIAGAELIAGDLADPAVAELLRARAGGPVRLVLSDMAPNTVGHRATDHLRVVALVELAAAFAEDALAPGGAFIAKVFQGGTEGALLARLKQRFDAVRHAKPPASRADSAETYLVAQGFRG